VVLGLHQTVGQQLHKLSSCQKGFDDVLPNNNKENKHASQQETRIDNLWGGQLAAKL